MNDAELCRIPTRDESGVHCVRANIVYVMLLTTNLVLPHTIQRPASQTFAVAAKQNAYQEAGLDSSRLPGPQFSKESCEHPWVLTSVETLHIIGWPAQPALI